MRRDTLLQEVAIVGDRDGRERRRVDEALEPHDALDVEVVGRLVEQEHVRIRDQRARERDPLLPAARELGDLALGSDAAPC